MSRLRLVKRFWGNWEVPYSFFLIIFSVVLFFSQKSLAIVNGEELHASQRPEIVRLLLYKESSEKKFEENGRCTGTAISDSLVLTAGHCITGFHNEKNDVIALHRFKNNDSEEIIPASKFYSEYVAEDLQSVKDEQNRNHATPDSVPGCSPGEKPLAHTQTLDLAILKFPEGTFKKWAQVNFAQVLNLKDQIELLGYGITISSYEASIPLADPLPSDLRLGKNQIWRTSEQRIGFTSQGNKPVADRGDSGAPIFYNGEVTAVVSTVEEKCETKFGSDYAIMNTATRLSTLEALNFFIAAIDFFSK
jgi:hypothetical protein